MHLQELIFAVSELNPGAMRACFELTARYDATILESMRSQGITGAEIWYLYKDVCRYDLDQMHALIQNNAALQSLASVRYSKFYQPQEAI